MRISGVVVHWSLTIDGMVERRHVWTESAPVQNADSIVGHVLERLGPSPCSYIVEWPVSRLS